jgi:hypothetical protein
MQATHHPAQTTAGTPDTPSMSSRRFDGKPETDADRRFFDLRESGYTGWIDQDGYPVDGPTFARTIPLDEIGTCNICGTSGTLVRRTTDPDPRVPQMACVDTATCMSHFAESAGTEPADELVTPAVTLRAAATYIVRYGWCQGGYYEQTGRGIWPAACIVAAIGMVCYGYQVDAPAQNFEDPGWGDFEAAVAYLDRYLAARHGLDDNGLPVEAYSFNDTRGRVAQEVIAVLREAADEWGRRAGATTGAGRGTAGRGTASRGTGARRLPARAGHPVRLPGL